MSEASPQSSDETAAGTTSRSFLFYESIDDVSAENHGALGLAEEIDYRFAGATNSIPVNGVEFNAAARHYPIIFNPEPGGLPLTIVGVRLNENLFIEDNGRWAEGCYVPAFVRRYPFIFVSRAGEGELAFCVDGKSPLLVEGGSGPLFQNGQSSDLLQNVARFCAAYARQQNSTRDFLEALEARDLLIQRSADITLPDGQKVAMRGFRVIDTAKLRELPGDIVDAWWRNGWLDWINCHVVSLGNFGRLYHRAKSRMGG